MSGYSPITNPFSHDNFPPTDDPANRETEKCELYPKRIQDEVNEMYSHDQVLYREPGKDYTESKIAKNVKAGSVKEDEQGSFKAQGRDASGIYAEGPEQQAEMVKAGKQ